MRLVQYRSNPASKQMSRVVKIPLPKLPKIMEPGASTTTDRMDDHNGSLLQDRGPHGPLVERVILGTR